MISTTAAQIKAAFRKAALQCHPDKHAAATAAEREAAEASFKQLNLAHAVLSDPLKRRQYDVGASAARLHGGGGGRDRGWRPYSSYAGATTGDGMAGEGS